MQNQDGMYDVEAIVDDKCDRVRIFKFITSWVNSWFINNLGRFESENQVAWLLER